jgi:hypothetical protein
MPANPPSHKMDATNRDNSRTSELGVRAGDGGRGPQATSGDAASDSRIVTRSVCTFSHS